MNTKKSLSAILEFSLLRKKNSEVQKNWTFEHNPSLIYSTMNKFHKKRLDMKTKTLLSVIFEFLILREKTAKLKKKNS